MDLYSDRVYRFILKSCRDTDLAKDIVQDAYVKLWERHEDLAQEKAKSWLFTTAYRIMIDGMRRSKKMSLMDEQIYEPAHREQWNDLAEILDEALKRLPEIQQQVILLRDYEGYDYKEIGKICGLTESQVKVYIYRGRKKLKTYLGSLESLVG